MKRITILLLSTLLIFVACTDEFDLFETEIDLTKGWEETVAVYANLNLGGGKNYIRVNRGFSSDNFFISNTNPDSIYFDPSQVEVKLYKIRVNDFFNGEIADADTLGVYVCRDTLINKDTSGIFSSEKVQLFYTETNAFFVNNADDLYVGLEVVTPRRVVTAYTQMIEKTEFIYPNRNLPQYPIENFTFDARLNQPINSQVYEVEGYCSYKEITKIDGAYDTVIKTFSFLMGSHRESAPVSGYGETHLWRESTELFYGGLEKDVLQNGDLVNTVARTLDGIYFVAYSGNADLALMTTSNNITTGFNTDPQSFTNIQNGLGYFSAYTRIKTKIFPYSQPTIDSVIDAYGDEYYFQYDFN